MLNSKTNQLISKWAYHLFPFNRSLTGSGNRKTISYIKNNINKKFILKKIKTSTSAFSWKVPNVWVVNKATLSCEGKKICDVKDNNLHLVGYSQPFKGRVSFKNLNKHLYCTKKLPKAIPYVTSYYKKHWGFCISLDQYRKLSKKKKYDVNIDTYYKKGNMDYAELLIEGKSKKEILICSYICHPSMANNELSGILSISLLSKIITKSKYSIRLLLIPETIGAISYIKKKFKRLKNNLVAGINITCVGIKGPLVLLSSISEDTYVDKIVQRIGKKYKNFKKLNFLARGSNERQFGCQNLKLPFVTLFRNKIGNKIGNYKEYHTSADNLSLIDCKTIYETSKFILKIIKEINKNSIYEKKGYCEPFLANTKLILNIATIKNLENKSRKNISDFLAFVDRNHDLLSLSKKINVNFKYCKRLAHTLLKKKLIKEFI